MFKTCFSCHYCLEAIMEKFVQLTCVVIVLQDLDDGLIFSGIACREERESFVCNYRQTEEAKMKVYIFV